MARSDDGLFEVSEIAAEDRTRIIPCPVCKRVGPYAIDDVSQAVDPHCGEVLREPVFVMGRCDECQDVRSWVLMPMKHAPLLKLMKGRD